MSHDQTTQSRCHHQAPLIRFSVLIMLCVLVTRGSADDIEVYLQPPADPVPPNVLFVLDESSSMRHAANAEDDPFISRRDALVGALTANVREGLLDNVNAALLGYSTTADLPDFVTTTLQAHTGDFSIVGEDRNEFLTEIEGLDILNYTPTTDALAAAVDWFNPDRAPTLIQGGQSLSSPLSGDPEFLRCAPNLIILLSDGKPNTTTRTEYEGTECEVIHLFDGFDDSQWYNDGARCAKEISTWAYQTDLVTDADWEGVQNIETHTISFGAPVGSPTRVFMDEVANAGGGTSTHADDAESLRLALESIIIGALDGIDYAMNAPTIPFNQDNAAISGDYIYVPLFYPEPNDFWHGNLKKYRLDVSEDEIQLRAQGGQRVLDDEHHFNSSVDLFCHQGGCPADEGDPLIGGAALNMTGERRLYTNLNPDPNTSLDHPSNRIHADNPGITPDMLGTTSEEIRTTLLQWISRDLQYTPTDTHPARDGVMGAPIHTQPEVVHYAQGSTVYLPTSEGVLEAIDADTGEELWAFMPQDLMTNISRIRNNNPSATPYYGLDGPLTIYETGASKIAIIGMRRGGEKYHMLDITNRLAPKYITEISREASPTQYAQLGQTWSKPLFVRMRINDVARDVLIFGGGYDPDQDESHSPDDQGNAIFIIDATSGSFLASISDRNATHIINGFEYAIPSDLATVDINGNGLVDRVYAADVGGRIMRVDFPDGENEGDAVSGGILADINQLPSGQSTDDHRKFFNTPQVGYYAKGARQFLVLLIGTGDRANPLDSDYQDRFYMIKDNDIWGSALTHGIARNFIDATNMVLNNAGVLEEQYSGWFIDLPVGEKSYSRAILYDYAIFFTTYQAERVIPDDPCSTNSTSGTAKIYGLNLISANAAINWNGDTEDALTITDRSTELALQGIPPSPMMVFPGSEDEHGNPILGKKIFLFADLEKKHEWGDRFRPIYWEEVIED